MVRLLYYEQNTDIEFVNSTHGDVIKKTSKYRKICNIQT